MKLDWVKPSVIKHFFAFIKAADSEIGGLQCDLGKMVAEKQVFEVFAARHTNWLYNGTLTCFETLANNFAATSNANWVRQTKVMQRSISRLCVAKEIAIAANCIAAIAHLIVQFARYSYDALFTKARLNGPTTTGYPAIFVKSARAL